MSPSPFILAVIPARGGSQGIVGKNTIDLCGVPLIAHTLFAARDSKLLTKTICSTDSEEIREVVCRFGGEVPFLRPDHLALHETPTLPVFQHAVRFWEEHFSKPEVLVLLQPTSPLRTDEHIDAAIQLLLNSNYDSVISVTQVKENPYWMRTIEKDQMKTFLSTEGQYFQRQALPSFVIPNGAIYVVRYETLMVQNKIEGENCGAYVMSPEDSADIDDDLDLYLARCLLQRRQENTRSLG